MAFFSTFKTLNFFLWFCFIIIILFYYNLCIFYISFYNVEIFLCVDGLCVYVKEVKAFQSHIGYRNILNLSLKPLNIS